MLRIENLYQRYGEREVLRDINLTVESGEVFALIGPTGAGKTTLLRLLALLERPSAGKICVDGRDAGAGNRLEMRRRIGFVLQKPVVFNVSVRDNIACGLRWHGVKRHEIRERIDRLLDLVKLSHLADKDARTLSGGEVQRVAIARTVAVAPELLLLDEPTANLDPVSTLKIEELLQDIFHRYRTTVIMATHDLSQGRRLASRIGVMMNGQLIQVGGANDIFSLPSNRAVAEFVGVENIISGVVLSREGEITRIDLGGGIIEAVSDYSPGEEVYACIRPEDITLAMVRSPSSARNSFPGEITRVVFGGSLASIKINCGFPLVALVTRRSVEELGLEPGRQVYASFKATAVHLIRKQQP